MTSYLSHVLVEAPHEDVDYFLLVKRGRHGPPALLTQLSHLLKLCFDGGVLRIDILGGPSQVGDRVFVATIHFGVTRKTVSGKSHILDHLGGFTFEKVASSSVKDGVTSENGTIDRACDLIAFDFVRAMGLAFLRAFNWLKVEEHVAASVARRMIASQLHALKLKLIAIYEASCRTWDVVFCTTKDLHIWEHFPHLHVAVRVIKVLVSGQHSDRRLLNVVLLKESADFCWLSSIN